MGEDDITLGYPFFKAANPSLSGPQGIGTLVPVLAALLSSLDFNASSRTAPSWSCSLAACWSVAKAQRRLEGFVS